MAQFYYTQNSFSFGEVSEKLSARGDLSAYHQGLLLARNVSILPTGGIARRNGTRYMDTLNGKSRLIAFAAQDQDYVLVLSDLLCTIYKDGEKVATLTTEWTEESLNKIQWTQRFDELILVHSDFKSKQLIKESETEFTLKNWEYVIAEDERVMQLYDQFEDTENIILTPSDTTGTVTLTASAAFFISKHIGERFRLNEGELEISSIESTVSATAIIRKDLTSLESSNQWQEPLFSETRGYPSSVAFHQDRLVIGGSKEYPNKIWFSKTSDLFNFDFGEGLDDEAIEFTLLAEGKEEIQTIFSGRHLQVLTSASEWIVVGEPLTPSSIQLKRQTNIGSPTDRYLPPKQVEGSTIFIAKNNVEIREFTYGEINENYTSDDIAILSQHLMKYPMDQDYNDNVRQLYIVMNDGTMAVMTSNKKYGMTAWAAYETSGAYISVAVCDTKTYVVTERNGSYYLERFEEGIYTDSTIIESSETATSRISGLSHLIDEEIQILTDGNFIGTQTIESDELTLDEESYEIHVGKSYTHTIAPMPVMIQGNQIPKKYRLIELTVRLHETKTIEIDTGNGMREIPLDNKVLDTGLSAVNKDIAVKAIGWRQSFEIPLWKIQSNLPYASCILSTASKIQAV